jgi:hypothetical protein
MTPTAGRLTDMMIRKAIVVACLLAVSSLAFAAPSEQGQANGERGGTPRAQTIREKTK